MVEKLTPQQFKSTHSGPDQLENFLALRALADFLEQSVISDEYDVPPSLVTPITLTQDGIEVFRRIGPNHRNEIYLSLFLSMWQKYSFIDFDSCKVEKLQHAISKEIKSRNIMHPYIFGRQFYDLAASDSSIRKDHLSNADSIRILSEMPPGVFQVYRYVSGPFGLLKSESARYSGPTLSVPGYHCEELTCRNRHPISLQTGRSKISRMRQRIGDDLRRQENLQHDWSKLVNDSIDEVVDPYSWHNPNGIISLIGDVFSLDEMHILLDNLRENHRNKTVGELVSDSTKLNEAETLQLILLFETQKILDSIDSLTLSKEIVIPVSEVRKSELNPRDTGNFSVSLQCTPYGTRFRASRASDLLRIRQLIDTLFDLNSDADRESLEWITRNLSGATLQEKVDKFVFNGPLEQSVEKLVFNSKSTRDRAIEFLEVGPRTLDLLSNEEVLRRVLIWKLGINHFEDPINLSTFQQYSASLKSTALASVAYTPIEQNEIRSQAAPFFVELETLLREILKLATWAMLRDHFFEPMGFKYSSSEATTFASEQLDEDKILGLHADGSWTLFPIVNAMARLADRLSSLVSDTNTCRPESQVPKIVRKSSVFKFVFRHTHPFLDLEEDSRTQIVSLLRESARLFRAAKIDQVRNDIHHPSPKFPTQSMIVKAIEAAQEIVNTADQAGFLPIASTLLKEEVDFHGRTVKTIGRAGREPSTLIRPSPLFLSRMPSLNSMQYLISIALYAGTNEMLRLGVRESSEYSQRWDNYPIRGSENERETWRGISLAYS